MLYHNGRYYARVSNVLSPHADFSHINKDVLKNKQQIGTAIHDCIKCYFHFEPFEVPKNCFSYFESFERWLAASNCRVVESEKRYYCDKLLLTGQIDALAIFPGETLPTLIDFKTSAQESPTWPMQAHLYGYLLNANNRNISSRYIFVKLQKQGRYASVYEYHYEKPVYNHCMLAVKNYWAECEKGCAQFSRMLE